MFWKKKLVKKTCEGKIVLQLEDIRRSMFYLRISILTWSKLNQIGEIRKVSYVIMNEVKIGGIQSFDK